MEQETKTVHGEVVGGEKKHAMYATFWQRLVAAIVDGILLSVAGSIIGAIIGTGGVQHGRGSQLITMVIGLLYYAYFESSAKQATWGKQLLGIVVTDMYGHRITFGRAAGRFFGKYVSALILMIGYIMAAFTEKKQALHDIIAGTLVVKK